jgi:hypothetical protein
MSHVVTSFLADFEKKYAISTQRGNQISFLGLNIQRRTDGSYTVDQSGYLADVLSRFSTDIARVRDKPLVPFAAWLADVEQAEDPPVDKNHYASIVMSLMYLARFTRADILFGVTYLSTKCARPTRVHYNAACHCLRWLRDTPGKCIYYECSHAVTPKVYADAAHAFHKDGKGQAGIFVTMGSGYIAARSVKIPMVTLSSTESEQWAMCEAGTYVVWLRQMMTDFGFQLLDPIKVYHDNLSCIWLTRKEGTFSRNKHILVRKGFSRELVENKKMAPIHMDTSKMFADMLTKFMSGPAVARHSTAAGLRDLRQRS